MTEVVVVPTGVANMASALAGLRRAGAEPRLAADASELIAAERVLLPGVGAFGVGMERLRAGGFDRALIERVQADRPTLAICLGLQLLCQSSEEDPGVDGLGLVGGQVRRFRSRPGLRIPQLGWNRIEAQPGCKRLASGTVYFANSFRLEQAPKGCAVATADHGGPFVAAFERGALLACQFHPELSGPFGQALLRRFVAQEEVAC